MLMLLHWAIRWLRRWTLTQAQRRLASNRAVMQAPITSRSEFLITMNYFGTFDKRKYFYSKKPISSESESSSSTEIEISRKSFSPNTIRRRRQDKQLSERHSHQQSGIGGDSDDEDATLNELMGKFDESYVYEKETDILSDSDQTECVSDLTGQEGGDECDTDELLDIDYIDTGSIQEITDKDVYRNTGSCTYHHHSTQQLEKRPAKLRKSRKSQNEENGSRRKKRLTRTRKRNSECRDGSQTSNKTDSPGRYRESRSVGGTPVSLRRNQLENQNKRFVYTLSSRLI